MRHPLHLIPSARGAIARVALAAVLILPAGAIAAPSVVESGSPADSSFSSDPRAADSPAAGVAALIAGFGAGLTAEPDAEGPFEPIDGKVDYGTAINTFGGGGMRSHEGQDMFAPSGTPEISPTATVVLETGTDGGRGNWAALYDPAAQRTYVYMHMLEPAAVKAGERLAPGDRVGLLGCTGSCDGAHLHFEIREGKSPYAKPIDPVPVLERWKRFHG
jgi:murein DD-endopeptidase MepM/ murein hydrolase activator NlpD